MRDTNAALLLITFLLIKHFICDWLLQSNFPYQFSNKGTYGHFGGLLHSGIATLGSLVAFIVWTGFIVPSSSLALCLILLLISSKIWLVLFAEFAFHYHVDWLKVNLNRWFQLNMTKDAGYWNLIGVDQMLHSLSYVTMVWYLLKG